jgi:hypothetical protein
MHYSLLDASPVSLPLWVAILVPLTVAAFAASGTWLTLWINRKRKGTISAEAHRTDAEARQLEVGNIADLYKQLREARAELAVIIYEGAEKSRELRELHAKQIEFLQSQVEIKTEAEYQAREGERLVRKRFHASQNEIQRCIFRIRDYEELLRNCEPKIPFEAFDFTPYEQFLRSKPDETV